MTQYIQFKITCNFLFLLLFTWHTVCIGKTEKYISQTYTKIPPLYRKTNFKICDLLVCNSVQRRSFLKLETNGCNYFLWWHSLGCPRWLCSVKFLVEHAASERGGSVLPRCSSPSLDFRKLLFSPLISKARTLSDRAMPVHILSFLTSFSSPAWHTCSPINYISWLH